MCGASLDRLGLPHPDRAQVYQCALGCGYLGTFQVVCDHERVPAERGPGLRGRSEESGAQGHHEIDVRAFWGLHKSVQRVR